MKRFTPRTDYRCLFRERAGSKDVRKKGTRETARCGNTSKCLQLEQMKVGAEAEKTASCKKHWFGEGVLRGNAIRNSWALCRLP